MSQATPATITVHASDARPTAPKVSVLTPIFNVERYLEQCLDSLAAQTLSDVEFICINDGSTDSSLSMLQRYAAADDRFVIIDKPNSGYGASMNCGLREARGEYVAIVESDDWASSNMLEVLYETATTHELDLCKANNYQYDDICGSQFTRNYPADRCGTTFCPTDPAWQFVFHTTPCIWAGLYRRAHLLEHDIWFTETPGASFQDTGFVIKNWIAARRAMLLDDAYLHYRIDRKESSVKSSAKVFCVCDEYESVERWLEPQPELRRRIIRRINACRVGTYLWNAGRLEGDAKRAFMLRARDEFAAAVNAGEFDFGLIAQDRQRWVRELIASPDQLIDDAIARDGMQRDPRVSVIVPAYNSARHIAETLASLRQQTLSDLEVLVINDGSTDDTRQIVDEVVRSDPRFRQIVFEANQGVGAARNMGLRVARGECLAFCDADDIVPDHAYEDLYRALKLGGAQMAVGAMREFSTHHDVLYPHTNDLAHATDIDKFDTNFNWTLSLCNKLFLRSVFEEYDIRFDDRIMGEDSIVFVRYLNHCDTIVGCKSEVYLYRQLLFFQEGMTATDKTDRQTIADHCRSFVDLIELRAQAFDDDIAAAEAAGQLTRAEQLRATKTLRIENLKFRLCTILLDRYYRYAWTLEEDAYALLDEVYQRYKRELFPSSVRALSKVGEGYQFGEGSSLLPLEWLAAHPLVSVVISAATERSVLPALLESLYHQRFMSFEVIVPASLADALPAWCAGVKNLRLVADEGSPYMAQAMAVARAPYVNVLEDPILHCLDSLAAMHRAISSSRADFVGFSFFCYPTDERGKLRSIREVYGPRYTKYASIRTPLNAIDCSLNNKVFKRSSVLAGECLVELQASTHGFAAYAYEHLSFKKDPAEHMVSRLTDEWFFAQVPPTTRALMEASNVDRYLHTPELGYRGQEVADGLRRRTEQLAKRATRIKNQVLFTTNRGDGLTDNLQVVYDALGDDVTKKVMCATFPHSHEYDQALEAEVKRSRIIVTDDYCHPLKWTELDESQHVIQLWHASGAFKHFGLDYLGADITNEKNTHRQYSAVAVSSEFVRPIYARAFGIDVDKVRALGTPRTDSYFDEGHLSALRTRFARRYPQFAGKRVVTYCPTFRQNDSGQVAWDPGIDWQQLSDALPADVVLIVKRHPLEMFDLVYGSYDNVAEIDDLDAETLCVVSDVMITDYSSIIFDCCLLGTPVIHYCPDLEQYDTGFYLAFPDDLFGPLVREGSALVDAIAQTLDEPQSQLEEAFKQRYMGACDGQATKRVVELIRSL